MKMSPFFLFSVVAMFGQGAMAQVLPADDFPNAPPGSALTIGADGTATVSGVINYGEDLDTFSFNVGSNSTLTIYTTGTTDTRGILRRMSNTAGGSTVLVTEDSGTENFRIVRTVEPGSFSIQVGGKISANGAVSAYTLHVELTPVTPPGPPDIEVPEVPQGSTVAFGAINVNTSATRTISVRNTGTGTLQLTGVTIAGEANTPAGTVQAFRIEEGAARSIAPGASSSFRVVFKPLTAGNFTGTVRIASNDPDENPWNFTVTGSGNAVTPPEVPDIDVSEVPQGSTVAFGAIDVNTSATRTVSVRNTGTGTLQLTGITISGDANTPAGTVQAFRVEEGAARAIAPGASSSFRLVFKPLAAGNFTGTVRIASNDPDENPWNFVVTGSGNAVTPPGSPEIAVHLGDTDLATGGTVSFGVVTMPSNGPVVRELVISNTGNAKLEIGSVTLTPVPTLDPNGGAGVVPQPQPPEGFFRVLTPPASSLDPNRTTVLRLGAGGGDGDVPSGRYMILASIPNSDSNENPFRLLLTAEVQSTPPPGAAEVDVFAGDVALKDDGTLDFGSTHTGQAIEKTVTIKNTGTGDLKLLSISVEWNGPIIAIWPPPPTPFRVEGVEPRIVAPGASTTCKVIFPATNAGDFESLLVIRNNDADENPFSVLLKASAEGDPVPPKEPEIAVSLEKADLPMNGTIDFGRTPLTVAVRKTITIANKGTAPLNVRAGFLSAVRGNNLKLPFRFSGEPFSTVAPGSSKPLTIVFQPVSNGKFEAMLIITNNDKDENPYRLKLAGQGGTDPAAVPDIGLKLGDRDLAINSTVDFGTAAPGTSVTKEIRITNSGTGELKLGRISFSSTGTPGGAANTPGAGADGALLPPVGALPFRVLPPANSVVPPGGSATLRAVYVAPASGSQTAVLSIESNDPDESPWTLNLKGTSSGAAPAPAEIGVSAGGADLPIGGKLDFGNVTVGSPVRREITVTNSGTGELRITGFSILPVEATANGALLFLPPNALVRVVSGPGAIAPGKSAGYVLEMIGFTAGPAEFNARISSNDADENPYTFHVSGVIVAPNGGGDPGNGNPGDGGGDGTPVGGDPANPGADGNR